MKDKDTIMELVAAYSLQYTIYYGTIKAPYVKMSGKSYGVGVDLSAMIVYGWWHLKRK